MLTRALGSYGDILPLLRDRGTPTAAFRAASDKVAGLICADAVAALGAAGFGGGDMDGALDGGGALGQDVLLVPVLRAGLALLPAFMGALPAAPVGFVGARRDERTASPSLYSESLPGAFSYAAGAAVILDPMLATGGSACLAAELLSGRGMARERIFFAGAVAAREGVERLSGVVPRGNITVAAVDPGLDARKFIAPGIGDYGDRYFGTQG